MRELHTQHVIITCSFFQEEERDRCIRSMANNINLITFLIHLFLSLRKKKTKNVTVPERKATLPHLSFSCFLCSTHTGSTPGLGLAAPSNACDVSPPSMRAACEIPPRSSYRPTAWPKPGWRLCTGSKLLVHRQCRTWASRTGVRTSDEGTWWASRSSSCIASLRTKERNWPPEQCTSSGTQQERRQSHTSGTRPSRTCPSGSEPSTPAARSAPCTVRMPSPGTASHTSGGHTPGGTAPGTRGRRTANGTLDGTWPSFETPLRRSRTAVCSTCSHLAIC